MEFPLTQDSLLSKLLFSFEAFIIWDANLLKKRTAPIFTPYLLKQKKAVLVWASISPEAEARALF